MYGNRKTVAAVTNATQNRYASIWCCVFDITHKSRHRHKRILWTIMRFHDGDAMTSAGQLLLGCVLIYFLPLLSLSFLLLLPKSENLLFFSFSCGSTSTPASCAAVIGFEPFVGFVVSRSSVVVTCPEVGALNCGDTPTGKVADAVYAEALWLLVAIAPSSAR